MNKIFFLALITGISTVSAAQLEEIQVCSHRSKKNTVLVACGKGLYVDGCCRCYIVREPYCSYTLPKEYKDPVLYNENTFEKYNSTDYGELKYVPFNRMDFKRSVIIQDRSVDVQDRSDDVTEFDSYDHSHESEMIIWTLHKNNPTFLHKLQAYNQPTNTTDKISTNSPIQTYAIVVVICAAVGFSVWWLQDNQATEKKNQ